MRLIPRRKRTWLLVLVTLAVVFCAATWWVGTEKSDFERKFDQIEIGMTFEEVATLMSSTAIREDFPIRYSAAAGLMAALFLMPTLT